MDSILKKTVLLYLFAQSIFQALFIALFVYQKNYILLINSATQFVLHFFFLFVPYKQSYAEIKKIIPLYLTLFATCFFPFILILVKAGLFFSLMWYGLIIVGITLLMYDNKKQMLMMWSIVVFYTVLVLVVVNFIPDAWGAFLVQFDLRPLNFLIILTVFVFLFILMYTFLQIVSIQTSATETAAADATAAPETVEDKAVQDRQNALYQQILDYFETRKPYLKSDFTESQLAVALGTNVSYISACLHANQGVSFNVFMNKYRIDTIKKCLNNNEGDKYTMQYIYSVAGYRHQSTFNRMFKLIEGITPTEYLLKIKQKLQRN